jgi:hypothetical protein
MTPRLLAAALLAALALPMTPAAAEPERADGACARTSWIAGSVDLCDGTLVYRDYVYDDYGADDPLIPASANTTTGSLSRPAGDARYRTARTTPPT